MKYSSARREFNLCSCQRYWIINIKSDGRDIDSTFGCSLTTWNNPQKISL